MTNIEHVKLWTTDLRTTTAPQTQHFLARTVPETGEVGFCCLGRGCEAMGLERREDGYEGNNSLPPLSFRKWLGLPEHSETGTPNIDSDTVDIDWPIGLKVRPDPDDREEEYANDFTDDEHTSHAAGLNDELGLSFSQIADIIDYFGVK